MDKIKTNICSLNMIQNVTVVIRSSGERTEKLCYDIVCKQVPKEHIFLINIKPFSMAVKKNFEIGIEEGRKWTLALDADILLKKNAVKDMIAAFEKLKDDYYIYQGYIYDKFYGEYRVGGPHLYRTSLLLEGIKHIPEEGTSFRPESETYFSMFKKGFHYYFDNQYYGIHDFEQNKIDIYRKFFLHAKKHEKHISRYLNFWKDALIKDEDFIVALRGVSDGLLYEGITYIDIDFFNERSKYLLKDLNLDEKERFIDLNNVDNYFKAVKKNKLVTKIIDSNNQLAEPWKIVVFLKRIYSFLKSKLKNTKK